MAVLQKAIARLETIFSHLLQLNSTTMRLLILSFFLIDIIMIARFCYVCKKRKKQQHETSSYMLDKGKVDELLYEIFNNYAEVD